MKEDNQLRDLQVLTDEYINILIGCGIESHEEKKIRNRVQNDIQLGLLDSICELFIVLNCSNNFK